MEIKKSKLFDEINSGVSADRKADNAKSDANAKADKAVTDKMIHDLGGVTVSDKADKQTVLNHASEAVYGPNELTKALGVDKAAQDKLDSAPLTKRISDL